MCVPTMPMTALTKGRPLGASSVFAERDRVMDACRIYAVMRNDERAIGRTLSFRWCDDRPASDVVTRPAIPSIPPRRSGVIATRRSGQRASDRYGSASAIDRGRSAWRRIRSCHLPRSSPIAAGREALVGARMSSRGNGLTSEDAGGSPILPGSV